MCSPFFNKSRLTRDLSYERAVSDYPSKRNLPQNFLNSAAGSLKTSGCGGDTIFQSTLPKRGATKKQHNLHVRAL